MSLANEHAYEDWLMHREQDLANRIQEFEEMVAHQRRTKKSLCAKQRTVIKSFLALSLC